MGTFGDTATGYVLIAIVTISAFIIFSFHSGKRKNREICTAIFNELMKVFKPDDQNFTNIGGVVIMARFLLKNGVRSLESMLR